MRADIECARVRVTEPRQRPLFSARRAERVIRGHLLIGLSTPLSTRVPVCLCARGGGGGGEGGGKQ